MSPIRLEYRNWKILLSQAGSKWSYACCPANEEPLKSSRLYSSYFFAYADAKTFVDRMIVRCEITNTLDDWLQAGQITTHQYDNLDALVKKLVKASPWSHLASVEALLQLPEEIPPGSSPERPA